MLIHFDVDAAFRKELTLVSHYREGFAKTTHS